MQVNQFNITGVIFTVQYAHSIISFRANGSKLYFQPTEAFT